MPAGRRKEGASTKPRALVCGNVVSTHVTYQDEYKECISNRDNGLEQGIDNDAERREPLKELQYSQDTEEAQDPDPGDCGVVLRHESQRYHDGIEQRPAIAHEVVPHICDEVLGEREEVPISSGAHLFFSGRETLHVVPFSP